MSEPVLDPRSFAFDADAEELAYQKLEDYMDINFKTADENSTLAIPAELRTLIDEYKAASDSVETDYDFLRLIFRTSARIVMKYHAWRDWIEKHVKDNPDLSAQYEKFVDAQEPRMNVRPS